MILLRNYFVNTTGALDIISVIHETNRAIREAGISEGAVNITVPAPGGAIAIIETLPDLIKQLKAAIAIFPGEGMETKNRRKEEIAVGPRVAAAILGKTIQIPVSRGRLVLGPREEPVLIDLEKSGRRREFYVQVTGEGGEQAQQVGRAQPVGRIQPQKRAVPKR